MGKTLVAYFSASGKTAKVAEKLAAKVLKGILTDGKIDSLII